MEVTLPLYRKWGLAHTMEMDTERQKEMVRKIGDGKRTGHVVRWMENGEMDKEMGDGQKKGR